MTEFLFANQITVQRLAEINAKLQPHVIANNQLFDRLDPQLEETTENLAQQLTELTRNLLNIEKRAYLEERLDHSRSLNSTASQDTAALFALPLPNGGYPAEGEFPETLGEFMSLEGPALAALLRLYGLPHQEQVADARSRLACHFSILL